MNDIKAWVISATERLGSKPVIGVFFSSESPTRKQLFDGGFVVREMEEANVVGTPPQTPKLYVFTQSPAERTGVRIISLRDGKIETHAGEPQVIIPTISGSAANKHIYSVTGLGVSNAPKPGSDAAKILAGVNRRVRR